MSDLVITPSYSSIEEANDHSNDFADCSRDGAPGPISCGMRSRSVTSVKGDLKPSIEFRQAQEYFYGDLYGSPEYQALVLVRLQMEFPNIPETFLRAKLEGWRFYSTTAHYLEAMEESWNEGVLPRPYVPSLHPFYLEHAQLAQYLSDDGEFVAYLRDEEILMLDLFNSEGQLCSQKDPLPGTTVEPVPSSWETPLADTDDYLAQVEMTLRTGLANVVQARTILKQQESERMNLMAFHAQELETLRNQHLMKQSALLMGLLQA